MCHPNVCVCVWTTDYQHIVNVGGPPPLSLLLHRYNFAKQCICALEPTAVVLSSHIYLLIASVLFQFTSSQRLPKAISPISAA